MDNNKKHTNPGLFFFCILGCILTGAFVTQPVAGPSPMKEAGISDILDEDAAALTDVEATVTEAAADSADAENTAASPAAEPDVTAVPTEIPADTPTPTVEPAETAVKYEVSPEAANGYWSKAEGSWFFVTDSGNYHGWLHDVDGETYYLNPETGAMTTGPLELDGKTYYFSADGVLMTGDVKINGYTYHLNADGSFNESVQAVPDAAPEVLITGVPYK